MLRVHPELVALWGSWAPDEVVAVVDDVEDRLAAATRHWQLSDVRLLPPSSVALLCHASWQGREVVLKVNPRFLEGHDGIAAEGSALIAWQQSGLVPLLYDLADGNATLLMERIAPACALREGEPMPEAQLEILGRLAVELHDADISVPGDVPTFRDSSFRKEWIHDLQRLGLDAEVEELEGLLGGLHGLALLHNDLHTRNVIRGEEKQGYGGDEKKWYAIDPKPCLGDPHLDHFALLALTHTITETFIPSAHVLEDWVRRYAQAAQLDEAILAALVRLRALALTGWLRRHQGNENWLRYLDLLIKALD